MILRGVAMIAGSTWGIVVRGAWCVVVGGWWLGLVVSGDGWLRYYGGWEEAGCVADTGYI